MKVKQLVRPFYAILLAVCTMVKSVLHLPQKYEDCFEKSASDLSKTDLEVDGFSKQTCHELAAINKLIYNDIIEYVKSGNVLDFGCGTGRHLSLFPQDNFCLTGIDLNEGSLNRARKKLPGVDFYNVNLLTDVKFIETKYLYYDLIYSISVLQYLQRWQLKKLFKNFSMMLQTGGILHCTFPIPSNTIDKWANEKYLKYTVGDISTDLISAGFSVLKAELLSDFKYTGRVIAKISDR